MFLRVASEFKLHYWPIITSTWCLSTFIITYIISSSNGHVYPFFPYISDTGTKPPESCIFGQMLNIEAVLLGISLYIRYQQVRMAIDSNKNLIIRSWNKWSIPFGLIACLGMSIVGNFQATHAMSVHMLGAAMTFCIGMIYFLIQVRISIEFRKFKGTVFYVRPRVIYFRASLMVFSVALFVLSSVCTWISFDRFTGENIEYWTKDDGGFIYRVIATSTEWIIAICMMIFVLTFTNEFKTVKFKDIHFDIASSVP